MNEYMAQVRRSARLACAIILLANVCFGEIRYNLTSLTTQQVKVQKLSDFKNFVCPLELEKFEMIQDNLTLPEFVSVMKETSAILGRISPVRAMWMSRNRTLAISTDILDVMISPARRVPIFFEWKHQELEGLVQRLKGRTVLEILEELDGKK